MMLLSSDGKKKSVINSPPVSQHLQFGQLQREVSQLAAHNRRKYQQIIDARPSFAYELIKVGEGKSVGLSFGRELFMKQMDRLMEEESFLNRELTMIRIEAEESHNARQQLEEKEATPFQVMKTVWNSPQQKYENAFEHAQMLNHIVGSIKISVRRLAESQRDSSPEADCSFLASIQKQYQQQNCQNCRLLRTEQKELKQRNQVLLERIKELNESSQRIEGELEQKGEKLRKLSRKIVEMETQANSKVMYLEQKLLLQDHQVKQLKKFKNDLQKKAFSHHNYQLFIRTEEDLLLPDKNLNFELEELLDFIASRQENVAVSQIKTEAKIQEVKIQEMSPEQLMQELALPIGKTQARKTAMTERPKSERRRSAFNNTALKLEDLDNIGKKYMRTNQLTSKRSKPLAYTPIQTKHTNSTLQLSDSPKSIEQTL